MLQHKPKFRTKIADSRSEFIAAQKLRYRIFVQELGGGGEMVDHDLGLERDRFDPYFDHILLLDDALKNKGGVNAAKDICKCSRWTVGSIFVKVLILSPGLILSGEYPQ